MMNRFFKLIDVFRFCPRQSPLSKIKRVPAFSAPVCQGRFPFVVIIVLGATNHELVDLFTVFETGDSDNLHMVIRTPFRAEGLNGLLRRLSYLNPRQEREGDTSAKRGTRVVRRRT